MQLEALKLEPMASGHLCLRLTERVESDGFVAYADQLMAQLGGTVVSRIDSMDVRLCEVLIDGVALRLAWDIWMGLSLESNDDAGDAALRRIEARLRP